jgi:hypothetical protein
MDSNNSSQINDDDAEMDAVTRALEDEDVDGQRQRNAGVDANEPRSIFFPPTDDVLHQGMHNAGSLKAHSKPGGKGRGQGELVDRSEPIYVGNGLAMFCINALMMSL